MNQVNEFGQRIKAIADEVGDLSTTAEVLFNSKAFLEIYEAPDAYADAAVLLYADPARPVLQKQIVGYAMQRLPLDPFVRLVTAVADLVAAEKLPARLLDSLAFPAFNWGAQLALAYDRPAVNALLTRLANTPQLSDQRRALIRHEVLTGKTREDVLTLKEAGQIP